MGKDAQIHIVVDDEQKSRWRESLEDSEEYSTLSHLIRVAVEKELSGESDDATESPALSNDVRQLVDDVEQIKSDLAFLKQQHRDEEDMSSVAQNVYDALQVLPTGEVGKGADADPKQYAAAMVVDEHGPQTIPALAEDLDMEPTRVEDAIEYLEEQFMPIVELTLNDQIHYFREE